MLAANSGSIAQITGPWLLASLPKVYGTRHAKGPFADLFAACGVSDTNGSVWQLKKQADANFDAPLQAAQT